ncbi:MAG: DNA-3-methyladenine glycosylase family protein, partial [Streptosporangiaceae bacterium]
MSAPEITIRPSGPFSLAEAATFGFGQRPGAGWDGVMRLAFCLDGYAAQVGVEVRQDDAGVVRGLVSGPGGTDLEAVSTQVARVLSLDHDGEEFVRIGQRDPVIGRLQQVAPGLRPPLFYSPYGAAAWSVLSARRPAPQMMAVRERLSQAHGAVFDLAGERLAAFPTPEALLGVGEFPGIPAEKIARLHGVAEAAATGQLAAGRLQALGPDAAAADLQQIKGIGPFYSSLIVIRATGFADVLPVAEPLALDLTAQLYGLSEPPGPARFAELAEPWRPLRTWAVVLIGAAGPRVSRNPEGGGNPAGQWGGNATDIP